MAQKMEVTLLFRQEDRGYPWLAYEAGQLGQVGQVGRAPLMSPSLLSQCRCSCYGWVRILDTEYSRGRYGGGNSILGARRSQRLRKASPVKQKGQIACVYGLTVHRRPRNMSLPCSSKVRLKSDRQYEIPCSDARSVQVPNFGIPGTDIKYCWGTLKECLSAFYFLATFR